MVLSRKPIICRANRKWRTRLPVVAFAEILTAVISGQCPEPPAGYRWYFGLREVSTIQMRAR
jgi:hypothetical protein